MNWNTAIQDFVNYLRIERSLSNNTVAAYCRDVKKLMQFVADKDLNNSPLELQMIHIQNFLAWLHQKKTSARSQSRTLSGVRTFYKFLLLEGVINHDPTELIEAPKLGKKLPTVLSKEKIDQLIGAINLSTPQGERNRALLEMLYGCGLRVTELINLKCSNLHFTDDYIKVVGKGNKERLVPVNTYTQKFVNLYRTHIRAHQSIVPGHEDFLFLNRRGKQLSRVMIFTIVQKLATTINLKKKISPHTFRHSFATHLVNGGADLRAVQEMLGHQNITTTEIYTHLDGEFLKATILDHHPRS